MKTRASLLFCLTSILAVAHPASGATQAQAQAAYNAAVSAEAEASIAWTASDVEWQNANTMYSDAVAMIASFVPLNAWEQEQKNLWTD